ncbi:MAG: flagellar filament capping protein FliD [Campylobacterota bacterium]|nr:flagellar filament capping protein FliD [Campylobacterota bacterium]
MADYSMLGTLSDGGASALSGDLLTKLRDADEKSKIEPLDTKLEDWDTELEKIGEIETKVNELLATVKFFDLFSADNNAFEQITASTSGDAAIFDAVDVGGLTEGTVSINITQMAQKDVYQTSAFADKDATLATGQGDTDKLTIQVGSATAVDFLTQGKTYDQLATEINATLGMTASVEQVGDNTYRLIIKSTDSGMENSLTITEAGVDLAINDSDGDGIADDLNHTLVAQNLNATVDGVAYDVSSNSITVDGNLKITATKVGDSTISIQKDDSYIIPAIDEMVTKYNELLELVNGELYATDSSMGDKASLRSMLSGIKDTLFATQGDDDISLFNYGFSFDTQGTLSVDKTILGAALTENFEDVKSVFIGVAEDKGVGTMLKEYIDDLNSYEGILTMYGDNMADRKTDLEDEKKKAIENLDEKYSMMGAQFAAYGAIIAQMEASFGGLKMMIAESTSSN